MLTLLSLLYRAIRLSRRYIECTVRLLKNGGEGKKNKTRLVGRDGCDIRQRSEPILASYPHLTSLSRY